MVRIFKQLNGAFMAEVEPYDFQRLLGPRRWQMRPMPLWKSSMSAIFSRESANFLIKNPKVKKLYQFLKPTSCADETIWATIAGNPRYISMPGGFDAAKMWEKIKEQWPKEIYDTGKYHGLNGKCRVVVEAK
uniref:Uncharacterized protein n=1 Tax=Acrobeloides nanus TaxID=290746 RepID=A0A914CDX2_9BILA